MSHIAIKMRAMNALTSGGACFVALLAMALWVGGREGFASIVAGCFLLFLTISFFALLLGALLKSSRIRWGVTVGVLSGLAGGCSILLRAISHI